MRLSTITSLAALIAFPFEAAATKPSACNADNCLRGVRASKYLARALTDCSSYFGSTTITPATITFTDTVTQTATVSTTDILLTTVTTTSIATTTVTIGAAIVPRQVVAPSPTIPNYASPCSGAVRYSSACSCLGVSKTTITLATPSTTITQTAVATESFTESTTSTFTTTAVSTSTIYSCGASAPNQVVVNTGFEAGLPPWTASRTGFSVPFRLSYCGVRNPGSDCDLTGFGCSCFFVNADSPGGTATLSQVLNNVCPGSTYAFSAYIGISNNIIPGSEVETTVAANLDGVQLFAPFYPCGNPNTACFVGGGSGPFIKIGPILVTPTRPTPVLAFTFVSVIDPQKFSLDIFVDDITLTKQ